jgi:Zn-dependent M28 family amino/carboxypeptidase
VGKRGDGPGDTIWNGADDDGSGTVAILEIAHAFATGLRPKRSTLFVWHAGEEKGLWGSDYFVEHPTVPLKNIVTQLNIDMIGRSRAPGDTKPANANLADGNSIYVIGSRRLSDELADTIVAVNKNMLKLNLDYKYDDPKDPEHFYERSDHYNYARKGIPIAFFFNGVHEDYHGAGDEVSKIDFVRMEKVTRTVYGIGWTVANTNARPKVNKPIQN